MNIPQIIEVAIGLAVMYYILGLIVSFIAGRVLEILETRGKNLEGYLKALVGEAKLGDLIALPQISSLTPARYDSWTSVFTGKLKEDAMVEKIPVANLVDAVFEMYGLMEQEYTADELTALLAVFPDSDVKANLLQWVEQKVSDANQLRAKTTMWFTGVMDQAAETYKAHARRFVIGLSLFVTLLFGVDSIEFAAHLWRNADLRVIAAAKAEAYLQEEAAIPDVAPLVQDLHDLSVLQIGWGAALANRPQTAEAGDWIAWVVLKLVGLGITFGATAQGSSFWYDILRRISGQKSASSGEGAGNG